MRAMLYQIRRAYYRGRWTAAQTILVSGALTLALAADASAQPGGGKTSGAASTKSTTNSNTATRTSTPKTKSKPATSTTGSARQTNAAPANIDGKWWTSGNDFGASEVVFTQTGANVSGVIGYSDGQTGSVTGTMVGKRLQFTFSNSSGVSGSGWLELSWNNFLGGPWHNERVRNGSWTLMRVEGKWCFQGKQTGIRTVTHNARGRVSITDEYGEPGGGYLEGPYLFLEDDGMTIRGDFDFRANRVNWSTGPGFFWTWCGRN